VIVIPYGHETHTRMNHGNRRGVSRTPVLATLPIPKGVGIWARVHPAVGVSRTSVLATLRAPAIEEMGILGSPGAARGLFLIRIS
jgi:hypothetical protein